MRPLFWTKIPGAKLTDTVWLNFDDTGIDINEDKLVTLFKKPPKKSKVKKTKGESKDAKIEKKKSVLDGQRSQNAGIAMTTVREKPEMYEDWIVRCSTKLTPSIINTLLKLVPTSTEMKMLRDQWNRDDKSEEIPPIDYFLLVMGDIPRVKERLQCILLSCEFEEKYESVLSNVTTIMSAVRKMKSSIQIKTIMETILALGNYINGSTRKGQCSAFELETLKMLAQTKGNDGKTTLMMFLGKLNSESPKLGGMVFFWKFFGILIFFISLFFFRVVLVVDSRAD